MIPISFGHGFKLVGHQVDPTKAGTRRFSAWRGRVLQTKANYCFQCHQALVVNDQVVVVEMHGGGRTFYHGAHLPVRFWLSEELAV